MYWLYILCNKWAQCSVAPSSGRLSGFPLRVSWGPSHGLDPFRRRQVGKKPLAHWVVGWMQFPVVMGLRSLTPCSLYAGPSLLLEALPSPQPAPSLQFPVLSLWGCEWNRLTQIIQDYLLTFKVSWLVTFETSARLHLSVTSLMVGVLPHHSPRDKGRNFMGLNLGFCLPRSAFWLQRFTSLPYAKSGMDEAS